MVIRGMKMKKHVIKARLIVAITALIALLSLFLTVSCAKWNKRNSEEESEVVTEKIFLITDNTPNCSMTISDETFKYLNKNDDYTYILDLMDDYFNVVINDEIEPNVVYIKAVSEKIDAEVRLAQVYEPSTKTTILIQIAEAGKSVFYEYNFDNTEENMDESLISEEEDNSLLSSVRDSLKVIADKGSLYSVKAIKDEFKEKTKQIYHTSDKIMNSKKVQSLKYNDYYIDLDAENGISIVCGSQETVVTALDYFLTEYISMGTSSEGNFSISVPDSSVHVGHYLSDTIGEESLSEYCIVYNCNNTYYDGRDNAKYLKEYFLKNYGIDLLLKNTDGSDADINKKLKNKIVIGKSLFSLSDKYYSESRGIMDYKILQQGHNLYILGGSDLAIRYAIDYLIDNFFSKERPIPSAYSKEGSILGKTVFPKYGDASLRLMSHNVWYNQLGNTWKSAGADASNQTRYKEMAKAYLSYTPDIIAFQELFPSIDCSDLMLKTINNAGGNYKFVDKANEKYRYRIHTPIIYNTDTLELLDSGVHIFDYGSNLGGSTIGTKSYTWGYFRKKSTGYQFIAFSTHLWYMKESAQEGSTQFRIDQMKEICQKANELIQEYDCACYVLGDYNCNTLSREFTTMSKYDFEDCYEIATEYANNACGRYICNNNSFSYKPRAGTYKKNAIDHIMVKNLKKARILSYNYALQNFYGKLSDHAPVYIDVQVRQ